MSQENVEIVRRHYEVLDRVLDEYWANPDVPVADSPLLQDSVFERLHPDAAWKTPVMREPVYGREGILRALQDGLEAVDDWRFEVERLVDAGSDKVFGEYRVSILGAGSGVPISQRVFAVITLRGGKIASSVEYTDRKEALEAAGLSE